MQKPRTHALLASGTLATTLLALPTMAAAAPPIAYNNWTTNAAISPPAEAFVAKLAAMSRATMGEAGALEIRKIPDGTPVPEGFDGDVLSAVGAGTKAGGLDAAYVTGLHLNDTWGFLYTSAVPFGPNFDEYIGFLYGRSDGKGQGKGLELLQATLDKRGANVIVVPIVGNSEQGSGYFPKPLSDVRVETCAGTRGQGRPCTMSQRDSGRIRGIGLSGLCSEPWKLRFVEPDLSVLNHACDTLVRTGRIKQKNMTFIEPVPGQGVFAALAAGQIQGFEVATPLDDVGALFSKPGVNPGTLGARFLHYPGWHQQFLISYMIINRDTWETWSDAQHALVYATARENVLSSYAETMQVQGEKLQEILLANRGDGDPSNDIVLSQWQKDDLQFLQSETIAFLNEHARDSAYPEADRREYREMLEALRKYVSSNNAYWKIRSFDTRGRFEGWKDDATGAPWEQHLK